MTARPAPLVCWRAVPASDLLFSKWGDDVVVFHPASGLTHLVNGPAALLLCRVLARPRTLDVAAQALAAGSAQKDEHFVTEVAALIERLEELGLVERIAG